MDRNRRNYGQLNPTFNRVTMYAVKDNEMHIKFVKFLELIDMQVHDLAEPLFLMLVKGSRAWKTMSRVIMIYPTDVNPEWTLGDVFNKT